MRKAVKRFIQNFKKDEQGLTLVELLAVVVILAIVGLIAFVAIGNVIENSREDAHIANAQQIISAAELYEASGGDVTATGFNIDSLDTLDTEILDPWTKEDYKSSFTLNFVAADTGNHFTISSTGGDGDSKCDFGGTTAFTKEDLSSQGREACGQATP